MQTKFSRGMFPEVVKQKMTLNPNFERGPFFEEHGRPAKNGSFY